MGEMLIKVYISVIAALAVIVFLRLLGTSSIISTYRSRVKLNKFVDIDRILASRMETPISIIMPFFKHTEKSIENINQLLKLNGRIYEVIILFAGKEEELEKLKDEFKLKSRFKVVRRQIKAPEEKATFFSTENEKLQLVVFDEKTGFQELLNAGVNISTYPYILPVEADCSVATNGLLAMSRPLNVTQGEAEVITAPIYFATKGKGPLHRDCWAVFSRSFTPNVILSDSFYLFRKNSIIREGGFPEKGYYSVVAMARSLKNPKFEAVANINDIAAVYNGDVNLSHIRSVQEKIKTYWQTFLRKRISYNFGYAQLTALTLLLRLFVMPASLALALYGIFLPELHEVTKALAVLLASDLLLEVSIGCLTAMLNQTARENIGRTIAAGFSSFVISFVELFLLFAPTADKQD